MEVDQRGSVSTSHGEQYVELNRSLARLQGSLNRFNASVTLAGRLSTKSVNVAQLFAAMYVVFLLRSGVFVGCRGAVLGVGRSLSGQDRLACLTAPAPWALPGCGRGRSCLSPHHERPATRSSGVGVEEGTHVFVASAPVALRRNGAQ